MMIKANIGAKNTLISNYTSPFTKYSMQHLNLSVIYFKVGLSHSNKKKFSFNLIKALLKWTKIYLHFMLKALFIFKTFLSWLFFGYVEKRLHKKAMANFNSYDITDMTAKNYNTHNDQYLKK